MSTHLHIHGVVMGFKTGATLCGRRVATVNFAPPNEDATCEGCCAERKREDESTKAAVAQFQALGVALPSGTATLLEPVSYRNAWFL